MPGVICRVTDLPEAPDLAVIATPASVVPVVVRDCVRAAIPAAVILSSGFKECGYKGVELEIKLLLTREEAGCGC